MRRKAPLALLAAVTVLAGGCTSSPSTSNSIGGPATRSAASSGAADAYSRIVTETMQRLRIPGAVVLVRTAKASWEKAFGTRETGRNDPVTVADHFRVGSNTKTMVGTVLLQLAQEGKVSLSDPVSKYRADVPNGGNITLSQLLDMRSGLFNYTELPSFNKTLDEDPGKAWQPEELVKLGLGQPPYFAPNAGFHYSNTNTALVGLIIEKVTGKDLASELSERIFTPLHLRSTSFPALADASIPAPSPHGYMYGTNVSTLETAKLPPAQLAAALAGTLQPNDYTSLNPSWAWAAGAAISDADDLATYVEAMVGSDKLLGAPLQQQRLDSVRSTDPNNPSAAGYGLALASFGPMLGHDGSLPGFQSFMGYDPKAHDTLIVLCNLTDGPQGEGGAANAIAKGIIAALYPRTSASPSITPER